jgi:hypothetical protein
MGGHRTSLGDGGRCVSMDAPPGTRGHHMNVCSYAHMGEDGAVRTAAELFDEH